MMAFLPACVLAQNTSPPNSNYLIEHGVSPRILDAAASQLLQDGSYTQDVTIETDVNGEPKLYKIQIIYDPGYEDGMDVRMVLEEEGHSKKEIKALKKLVEKSHHFSRMSEHYLYDESTLKLVKDEGGEVVFEYYYKRQNIEPYLKHIKRLKGNIVFIDGELDRVELTNTKKLNSNVVKMKSVVRYTKTIEDGGYIITSVNEHYEQKKGKDIKVYDVSGTTSDYLNTSQNKLSWEGKENITPMFGTRTPDTVSVKLGWFLPLMGKPATKLGYKLPRPVGFNLFSHFQHQTMQFTGISIAMNDEEFVSFNELFNLDESTITASSFVTMLKADVWILPFLNIMAIAGVGENNIEGNWPIDEDVKEGLADWGWLIGIEPEDIPDAISLSGGLESVMYGLGATLAGGVGDWNLNVSYQFMVNETQAANTTTVAHILMPMAGYMTKFGMNLMVGAQGQFYDTKVAGFIDLEDGQRLHYNVDFKPVKWNAILGIYKGFSKHWELALQAGVGNRTSVTAVFGYRL